ncbi:MAG: MYXO-CTERM sorting domain-containing protein [Polyangiaceae bacterium]
MNPARRLLSQLFRLLPRLSLYAVTVLAVLAIPTPALAGGGFTVKTTEVTESQGEWHVKVRIDLSRAPGMMHIPMRFTFSKEAVDERAIMSRGAEPVHHRNVLDVTPKQIQSMDVDFADPSGKVFKSTYFEFDLRRDGGYFEAGEYQVSLSGPDGDVGGSQKLVLKGDNPPVYRGAMDFTDPKAAAKKGPKIQSVDNGVDAGAKVASNDDSSGSGIPAGDVQAVGNGGSMVPDSAFNKTSEEEAVQGHPKGCGCVAAGLDGGTFAGGSLALLGLGLVVARRRR